MKEQLKVAQIGLGPIGLECLRVLSGIPWARVVGAIDIDPAKCGANLAELTREKRLRGIAVCKSTGQLKETPDLIFHTAVSRFKNAYEQLDQLARRGINVVSSCEELVFPSLREPRLAASLDRLCRASGARIVGTGVNPGFVMDVLPLCLTMVARDVRSIRVQRVVDAATRREPLQRKIGSGQPPAAFRRRLRSGDAGHAGLRESLALIAHAMGWQPVRIVETADAVIAKKDIQTSYFRVRKGEACGLHQRAEARTRDGRSLSLDLKMCLDAQDPHDAIQIEANPPVDVLINGGVAGDYATVAALVNTAPRLMQSLPGLKLLTELPIR